MTESGLAPLLLALPILTMSALCLPACLSSSSQRLWHALNAWASAVEAALCAKQQLRVVCKRMLRLRTWQYLCVPRWREADLLSLPRDLMTS